MNNSSARHWPFVVTDKRYVYLFVIFSSALALGYHLFILIQHFFTYGQSNNRKRTMDKLSVELAREKAPHNEPHFPYLLAGSEQKSSRRLQ